jgi:DNA-binding NtrC family response regulator
MLTLDECLAILAPIAEGLPFDQDRFRIAARTFVWIVRNDSLPNVECLLTAFEAAANAGPPLVKSRYRATLGHRAVVAADFAAARLVALEGRDIAILAHLEAEISVCCTVAGTAAYRMGLYDEAVQWYEEALVAARRAGVPFLVATALSDRAMVARLRGDGQLALTLVDQAIAIYASEGADADVARCYLNRGIQFTRRGDLLSAKTDILAAKRYFEANGLDRFLDSAVLALARIHLLAGDTKAGQACVAIVLSRSAPSERLRTRAIALEYSGDAYLELGDPARALACYRDAFEIANSVGEGTDLFVESAHRVSLASCLSHSSEVDPIALGLRAIALAEGQGDAHELAAALLSMARSREFRGECVLAQFAASRCLAISADIGDRYLHAKSALLLSRLAARFGETLEAFGLVCEARRVALDCSSPRLVAETETALSELAIGLRQSPDSVASSVAKRQSYKGRRTEVQPLEGISEFLTGSRVVRDLLSTTLRLAPRGLSMLILGETGTGKELVAEAIHRASERKGPFVPVNCGALPGDLLEAELFGHARGAYTGADRERGGLIEYSNQGTLFLDEIGDMPLKAQARLLRALEKGEVRRLGEVTPRLVNLRIVAATHRNLLEMVSGGEFRLDLYHRLSGFVITLPPLRERGTDVDLLIDHFVASYAKEQDKAIELAPEVRELLARNAWPGNVRQLRNVIHRLVSLSEPGQTVQELPFELEGATTPRSLPEALDAEERRRIVDALNASGWNKAKAAAALGASRTTLIAKMKRLRIEPPTTGARVR